MPNLVVLAINAGSRRHKWIYSSRDNNTALKLRTGHSKLGPEGLRFSQKSEPSEYILCPTVAHLVEDLDAFC
jgi:hypothetical protein